MAAVPDGLFSPKKDTRITTHASWPDRQSMMRPKSDLSPNRTIMSHISAHDRELYRKRRQMSATSGFCLPPTDPEHRKDNPSDSVPPQTETSAAPLVPEWWPADFPPLAEASEQRCNLYRFANSPESVLSRRSGNVALPKVVKAHIHPCRLHRGGLWIKLL
ncbi:hypothetical protein J3459_014917 [Metarhizium acridum]|uniref:uncharacterized protein n=1 Tax=Metarhizium acridum TaxID=92637 RepID=UPI001C6B9AC2|nr:hypothetical protein J3459_014917 [Metarhizium acridum]KAG8419533.1 hypothetical protein J3458_004389 [Metarhizium acridum]